MTPSLNQGVYIERCILSVLDQGYPKFEHIIVDGASEDETPRLVRKYRHLKFVSEADRGQANALNKGFALAQGELVG